MNRLERLTSIITQLQSKRIIRAKELADRYEVSLRTIYRDIESLQNSGVPISSESGVGYFLVDGYTLPPVAFTSKEAYSLIAINQLVQMQADTSLIQNYESLLSKIKSVLQKSQRDQVEILENRSTSYSPPQNKKESSWLSEIQEAISRKNLLQLDYDSIYKMENTIRIVEPLAVYFTNQVWLLVAFCQLRNGIREFRLDRIQNIELKPGSFSYEEHFELQEYFTGNTD